MLYDPGLENRLNTSYGSKKLAPTLSDVTQESYKIVSEKDEYKNLLKQLAESSFVKEMRDLKTNIIN